MRENLLALKEKYFYLYPSGVKRSLAAHLLAQSGVSKNNILFSDHQKIMIKNENCFFILFDSDKKNNLVNKGVDEDNIYLDSVLYALIKSWEIIDQYKEFSDFELFLDNASSEEQITVINNFDKCRAVYEFLENESKQLYLNLLLKRLFPFSTYIDVLSRNQYFPDEVIKFHKNEIFVDIGAFNGDTISSFIKSCPDYLHIFAFEPDNYNFIELVKNTNAHKNITYINCACGNNNQFNYFNGGLGSESSVSQDSKNGEELKYSLRLDSIDLSPTFIKIDTEGFELPIINGLKDTIARCLPKLAICVYHRTEDLWEIPIFIHNLCPEYKLYLKHHSAYCIESVLYAIKKE